jgi:hypothetical protein
VLVAANKQQSKAPAKEESVLFADQKQTTIPVQYDVKATTPSGSVSVDTVSPEELKQNLAKIEQPVNILHDLATIALEEITLAIQRALDMKHMAWNIAAGFKESLLQ